MASEGCFAGYEATPLERVVARAIRDVGEPTVAGWVLDMSQQGRLLTPGWGAVLSKVRRLLRDLREQAHVETQERMAQGVVPSESFAQSIAHAREVCQGVTPGPWEVKVVPLEPSPLGVEQGMGEHSFQTIQTSWIHGQLKSPESVFTLSSSPYWLPNHWLSTLNERNPQFVAAARSLVPELAMSLEAACTFIQELIEQLPADQASAARERWAAQQAEVRHDQIAKQRAGW